MKHLEDRIKEQVSDCLENKWEEAFDSQTYERLREMYEKDKEDFENKVISLIMDWDNIYKILRRLA